MLIKNIPCPNCGDVAERYNISTSHLTKTECSSCDYLMVMCSQTGKVIEAYAPGIDPRRIGRRCLKKLPVSRIHLPSYLIQTLEPWKVSV